MSECRFQLLGLLNECVKMILHGFVDCALVSTALAKCVLKPLADSLAAERSAITSHQHSQHKLHKMTETSYKTPIGIIEPLLRNMEEMATGMAKDKIDWAPREIPLERRLQTAAALIWVGLLPMLTIGLNILCLLWKPVRLFYFMYFAYVFFDPRPEHGGAPSRWFRGLKVWRLFADYFPSELKKTAELDTSGPILMGKSIHEELNFVGFHPHGVIGVGSFTNFTTNIHLDETFPGIDLRICTLHQSFKIPFFHDFLLNLGLISVNKKSIQYWLRSKPGAAVMIVVGGAEEAFYAIPDTTTLVLAKRFGFVKIALEEGASLVPVFCFGETNLYHKGEDGPWRKRISNFTKKTMGFTAPNFIGRGIFQYSFGVLPMRRKLTAVVGEPIKCPKTANPSEELIKEYHEMYVENLRKVYDTHKDALAPKRRGTMVLM